LIAIEIARKKCGNYIGIEGWKPT